MFVHHISGQLDVHNGYEYKPNDADIRLIFHMRMFKKNEFKDHFNLHCHYNSCFINRFFYIYDFL